MNTGALLHVSHHGVDHLVDLGFREMLLEVAAFLELSLSVSPISLAGEDGYEKCPHVPPECGDFRFSWPYPARWGQPQVTKGGQIYPDTWLEN